ncbi:MAG: hypothetical protein LC648_03105 [Novosphingobium sp.]|nr:hypothetical protein [Novosphingobium sp.]
MRRIVGVAIGCALAAAAPAPAAAQAVVVRASGPSAAKFPVGLKLGDGAKVALEAGDTVTVLDRAGSRVLKGKGAFIIDSKVLRDRGLVGMLSRSLNNPTSVRAGAVRGVTLVETRPLVPKSVWIADIDRGGKVCVPQGSDLYLWRHSHDTRRTTWLGEAEGGATVRLLFPQRTSGVAWPSASLPLIAGRSYRLNDDGAPERTVDFEIVTLAPDAIPDNAAELGSLLLDRGCAVQFEALADSLEKMGGEGEAAL